MPPAERVLRLLLIEDNDRFRETLELLFGLRSDVEVVGSLADGARAAEACRELLADVVVLDYRLPGLDSVEVARAVHELCPQAGIVCLTGEASEAERAELDKVGVSEILAKDEELDRIVDALHRAAGQMAA